MPKWGSLKITVQVVIEPCLEVSPSKSLLTHPDVDISTEKAACIIDNFFTVEFSKFYQKRLNIQAKQPIHTNCKDHSLISLP